MRNWKIGAMSVVLATMTMPASTTAADAPKTETRHFKINGLPGMFNRLDDGDRKYASAKAAAITNNVYLGCSDSDSSIRIYEDAILDLGRAAKAKPADAQIFNDEIAKLKLRIKEMGPVKTKFCALRDIEYKYTGITAPATVADQVLERMRGDLASATPATPANCLRAQLLGKHYIDATVKIAEFRKFKGQTKARLESLKGYEAGAKTKLAEAQAGEAKMCVPTAAPFVPDATSDPYFEMNKQYGPLQKRKAAIDAAGATAAQCPDMLAWAGDARKHAARAAEHSLRYEFNSTVTALLKTAKTLDGQATEYESKCKTA